MGMPMLAIETLKRLARFIPFEIAMRIRSAMNFTPLIQREPVSDNSGSAKEVAMAHEGDF